MGLLSSLLRKKKYGKKYGKGFDKKQLKFNLERDPEDSRDYPLSKAIRQPLRLPKQVNLQKWCTNIKNQGNLGACTGFSLTGAFEIYRKKYWKENLDMSELFSYYQGRVAQGWENKDTGAYLRDVCRSGVRDGIAFEFLWSYKPRRFNHKPPLMAYLFAKLFKFKGYYRCWNANQVKQALSAGLPVVFGFMVRANFLNYKGGVYKTVSGRSQGGHAVTCIGYDDDKNAFLVRNSWGVEWGEKGYFWMDYYTFENLLIDAWAVQMKVPNKLSRLAMKLMI